MARYQKSKYFKGKFGEIRDPVYRSDISIILNVAYSGDSSIYSSGNPSSFESNWEFLCTPRLLPGLKRLT